MSERAYAPYSGVLVGACGLADDGRLVRGCNVENASYGLTLCAECGLVSDLAASGGGRLVAVAVVAGDGRAAGALRALPAAAVRARRRRACWWTPGAAPADASATCCPAPSAPTTWRRAPAGEPPAVDVIRAKRDGARAERRRRSAGSSTGYTRGTVRRRAGLGAADGDRLPRPGARRARRLDRRDDRLRRAASTCRPSRCPTVDKHSTGGVGDKISLPLCPLVAACGAAVPQLSGRGLGHTGGHARQARGDPRLPRRPDGAEGFVRAARATSAPPSAPPAPDLAPADRKLYALRDVTGTVESIPLIASSIMSKKIAEGTAALVLDVKVGRRRLHAPTSTGRRGARPHHGGAGRGRTACARRRC